MGSLFQKMIFVFVLIMIIDAYFFCETVEAAPLNDVCRLSFDPHFCLTNFGWKSSTKTAPIPVLANLALEKVIENLNITENIIQSLLKNDIEHHNILLDCNNLYAPALSSLLASGYYNLNHVLKLALKQQATQAFNAADHCQNAYAVDFLMAPFETHIFNLKRLSDILGIVVSFLKP